MQNDHAEVMRQEREGMHLDEIRRLRSFLASEGYRPCDIPECNCGSYHKVEDHYSDAILEVVREVASKAHHASCTHDACRLRRAAAEALKGGN